MKINIILHNLKSELSKIRENISRPDVRKQIEAELRYFKDIKWEDIVQRYQNIYQEIKFSLNPNITKDNLKDLKAKLKS